MPDEEQLTPRMSQDGIADSAPPEPLGPLEGLLGVVILLFPMAIIAAVIAWFYIPIRLHLLGTIHRVTVATCERQQVPVGCGVAVFYVVRVNGYDQDFPVAYRAGSKLKKGDEVALLYSDTLKAGVVLPGGRSFWHVIYHYGGGAVGVLVMVLGWLAAIIGGLGRLALFGVYVTRLLRIRLIKTFRGPRLILQQVVAASEFLADTAFVLVSLCLIGLLSYGLVKAVLYVERSSWLLTGFTIMASGAVLLSPLPERIVRVALDMRSGKRWRHVLRIGRNVLATVVFGQLCWKIIRFMMQEEFQSYRRLLDVGRAFLGALF